MFNPAGRLTVRCSAGPVVRALAATACLAPVAMLLSCDQQQSAQDIDPRLGFECFESLRGSLPPGTQYEGIDKLEGNRLTIKIMNGVEVVAVDCSLNPGGTVQGSGRQVP
jgi:hypothetical protein